MTDAVLDLKRWGNNLGVRLPAAVANAARLHADQRVQVSVDAGRVIISPVTADGPSLAARLALFDPARHGGESMAGSPMRPLPKPAPG